MSTLRDASLERPSWRAAAARIAPFGVYIAFLALTPLLKTLGVHDTLAAQFDMRWLYGVQIASVVIVLVWVARECPELHDSTGLTLWPLLASLASGLVIFGLWIHLDSGWMITGESAGFNPSRSNGELDWALIAVRLAGASLVVPVMEELFWRSFVMRWIKHPDFQRVDPARAGLRALLISSLVFGFEHHQWFAGLLAGLAYGALYLWARGLWLPIISHATTNAALGLWIISHHEWRFW